jgi:hypothetical protein
MIQNLIAKARNVLEATLGDVVSSPAQRILAAPVSAPTADLRPLIVLSAGDLIMSSPAPDSPNSQPRPQPHRERIALNPSAPDSPYLLHHQPLRGSAQAVAIVAEGEISEQRLRLQETQDYTVDYAAPSITFRRFMPAASAVHVSYSFVGIFTIQDFQQALLVDVFAADVPQLEQLASLTTGALLTAHDDLLDAYNRDPVFQTTYTSGSVTTTHRLSRVQLLTAHMAYTPSIKIALGLQVAGQLTASRAIQDGFGLIEKVRSPGATSIHPVDIEIGVE